MASASEDASKFQETIFVPEMGVHPIEGKQEKTELEVFKVDNEVLKFLEDEKLKVLLIQGGGGSGKSLFCHIFAKELLEEETELIPIFINLPTLKDPLNSVINETLKNCRFCEEEIVKMQKVKLLLFLDGYDEIKKT